MKTTVLSPPAPASRRIGNRRSLGGRTAPVVEHRVEALAAIGALAALLLSDGAPTGLPIIDPVYRMLFGTIVVVVVAQARRWSWPVIAGGAVVVTGSLLAQLAAVAAVVVAVVAVRSSARRRSTGALIAVLSSPALLTQGVGPLERLTGGLLDDPNGSSTVATILLLSPAAATAWNGLRRRRRRTMWRHARRAGVAIGALGLVTFAAAAAAAQPIRNGLVHTEAAAAAARDGDLVAADLELRAAAADWRTANGRLSAPWVLPARAVPVIGQHVRAAQVTTGQAAALSGAGAALTARLDPDALIADGVVDMTELASVEPALDALAHAAASAREKIADLRSPWLIRPVGQRIDRTTDELTPAARVFGASAAAAELAQHLLGDPQGSTILVLFSTPAEARGSGGFVGNFAEFRATSGRVELVEQYRAKQLNDALEALGRPSPLDGEFAVRYDRFSVERHVQDVTLSPDFPSVARATSALWEQATGRAVDAVLLVDPFVVQQLLAFTGPVSADGLTLTGANAADELLTGQYIRFAEDDDERTSVLDVVASTVVERLFAEPPAPVPFAQELAPLAAQGRLALWLAADTDGTVVGELGLGAAFPDVDDDVFAVVHQNSGQNKIDTLLQRTITLDTVLDPETGFVDHETSIRLVNEAPASGLPPSIIGSNDQGLDLGTNRMILSVYSALDIVDASLDGESVAVERQNEFGVNVYSFPLAIPARGSVELDLRLRGRADLSDGYQISLPVQPLSRVDDVSWQIVTRAGSIVAPADWQESDGGIAFRGRFDSPHQLSLELD